MRAAISFVCVSLGISLGISGWSYGEAFPMHASAPMARDQAVSEADRWLAQARQLALRERPLEAYKAAQKAISRYEDALRLGGEDPELHYRAVVASDLYVNASTPPRDWRAIIRHAEAFRTADPLDPRDDFLTPILCHALAHEAGQGGADSAELFARGIAEYERWFFHLDQTDPWIATSLGVDYMNLAELLMAVGKLEEATDYYRMATPMNTGRLGALPYYGLAVAYDRAGQFERAGESMRRALELDSDSSQLHDPDVYFVPAGDVHYYEALAHQIAGRPAAAATSYRLFLSEAVKVQDRYRLRARAHLEELRGSSR